MIHFKEETTMKYIASVRNKETRELTTITSEYPNKKEFAEDLRGNGYSIRFISTEDKFDADCEKWLLAMTQAKHIIRSCASLENSMREEVTR